MLNEILPYAWYISVWIHPADSIFYVARKGGGDKMLRARTIFKSFTKRSRAFNVPLTFPWLPPYSTKPLLLMNVSKLFPEFILIFSHDKRYNHRLPIPPIDWWFLIFVNFGLSVLIVGRKKMILDWYCTVESIYRFRTNFQPWILSMFSSPDPIYCKYFWLLANTTGPMYFVLCCLYPSSPQPPLKCLTLTCHLSTLNLHCFASAGLPIHMIGEVSWRPKKKMSVGLLHCP